MTRILVIALLAAVTLQFPTVHASDISLTDQGLSLSSARLEISRTSPQHTSISLLDPGIEITEFTSGFETYQVPMIEGEFFIQEQGSPAVPQIVRFCRIPN